MAEASAGIANCLWLVCTLVAIIGCVYAGLASFLIRRYARRTSPKLVAPEAVTLLKPLCGAETHLLADLEALCTQNYPGRVQLVCGIQDPADPAIAVVERLRQAHPGADISLVVSAIKHGENPKISNVLNMMPSARHDTIILSDSDMSVGRTYVRDVVATLQQPGIGAVSCLYRGRAVGGIWSRLAASAVDCHFLPSVLVGLRFGLATPCFGSTIAMHRETLRQIGGFEAVRDVLADDYVIGDLVRQKGQQVAVANFTIGHAFSETSFGELVRHELRWARTIRLLDPVGYAASIVTHPLPFALAAAALSGFSATSAMIMIGTLVCRMNVPLQVARLAGGSAGLVRYTPIRDLLSFAIFLVSLGPGPVSWRGSRFRVGPDGSLTQV